MGIRHIWRARQKTTTEILDSVQNDGLGEFCRMTCLG